MFNEVINDTHKYQSYFLDNVQSGEFAKSFPADVIDKILEEEHELQHVYEDAQMKVAQINQLTTELRTMV